MATEGENPELKDASDNTTSPLKDVKPLSVRTLSDSDIVVITKERPLRRLSQKPTKSEPDKAKLDSPLTNIQWPSTPKHVPGSRSGSLDISPLSMNVLTPPPPPTTPDQSPFKDILVGTVEEKQGYKPNYYRGESREQLISRLKHISMVSLASSVDSMERLPSDIKAVLEKDPDKLSPNRLTRGVVKALRNSRIVPSGVKPYLQYLGDAITAAIRVWRSNENLIREICLVINKMWGHLEEQDAQDFLPLLCGFVMLFFGGNFLLLISAIEAYRISGWHKTRKCALDLYHNYKLVKAADEMDEKELLQDKDNDGVTDALQISDEEYMLRKVDMVLRVVQPQQVFDAISGISVGFFAVVATLKLKTARAVTLGTSLGNMFELVVTRLLLSDLQELFGEYREWVLPLIHYTSSFIGVLFAYTLYVIISSFHCSVRGASFIVHGAAILNARFFKSSAVVPHVDEIHADPKWAGFTVILGTIGFFKQFTDGFVIKPWILKLMLGPFLFAEYALWAIVLNSH